MSSKYGRRISPALWGEQPFGRVPDRVIARRLGVSSSAVLYQRIKRGIAAASQKRSPEVWDAQPLGQVPDREIAELLGVSVSTVCRQRLGRGLPPCRTRADVWDGQPFGEVSDAEIAERLGVTTSAVQSQRNRRGVAAYAGPKRRSSKCGRWLPRSTWSKQPFGEVSDAEIAKGLGVSPEAVLYQRRKRGIPPYKRPAKK